MTPRDRRVLVIGAVIVVVALLTLRVIPSSVRRLSALREETAAQGALVARMRRDVASLGPLTDSAVSVRRQFLALGPRIVSGGTEAEAVASLSAHLGVLATRSSATLERADAVPDSTRAGELRRVTLRAAFESDARGALSLVGAVETDPIALPLGSLRLVAPDPSSADGVAEIIKGEFTVSGWYLAGSGR